MSDYIENMTLINYDEVYGNGSGAGVLVLIRAQSNVDALPQFSVNVIPAVVERLIIAEGNPRVP